MEYTAKHFDTALEIAMEVHGGVERRDGQAYMTHVLIVAMAQRTLFGQICALLHDVLEDCPESSFPRWHERIRHDLGYKVLRTVLVLTKMKDEKYEDYIEQILMYNGTALQVKLADLEHNMSDGGKTPPQKYVKAHALLTKRT